MNNFKQAKSGVEARDEQATSSDRPFRQSDTAFRQNIVKSKFEAPGESPIVIGTARISYLSSQGLETSTIEPGSAGRGAGVEDKWNISGLSSGGGDCTLDGAQCPNNNCGPQRFEYHGLDGKTPFLTTGVRAQANGTFSQEIPADVLRTIEVDSMILAGRANIFAVVNYFNGNGIDVGQFEVTVKIETEYEELDTSGLLSLQLQTRQQGFKLGDKGVAFTAKEKSLLNAAFKYVNSKKCLDWINKTLEPFIKFWDEGGQKGTPPFALSAIDLISKVSINKYSPSLTAQQMGITTSQRKEISDNENSLYFFDGFVGVNVGDQVWLQDIAFKDYSGSLSGSKTDLPASIVHELFHAFGFKNEKYVKGLNKEIQENCGWGGYVGGGL